MWPEWSRQIFEAGSRGEPAAPRWWLTPRGSIASAGHGEINDAAFAAGIRSSEAAGFPTASWASRLGKREEPFDVWPEGTEGRCVSPPFPSPLHQHPNFGAWPHRPGFPHRHFFSKAPALRRQWVRLFPAAQHDALVSALAVFTDFPPFSGLAKQPGRRMIFMTRIPILLQL